MEPKSKKVSAREAVEFVRTNFPPGTKLCHRPNGDLYMIGGKHGMGDFWMMPLNRAEKGIVPATQIMREFEPASA
jgi:hypothetical protein